jgi:uncharacterized protein
MAGDVSFFELGVEDVERGRAFYGALFGWDFAPGPGEGIVITNATVPGGIHGGDLGGGPYVFFRVDDIEAAAERVQSLGGSVEGEAEDPGPEEIARFGRFRMCRDDQGSPFGIHEPAPS